MSVTLRIEIPEVDIQRLLSLAKQQGLSLDDFVLDLVRSVCLRAPHRQAGTKEIDVPLGDAQQRVSKSLTRFSENFDDLSLRLSAGVQLQNALRTLEVTARKKNFRLLSRVAAVLHDTLKHNHIEGFSRTQLTAFKKATHEAIKTDPQKANPSAAERHLFRAQLSWLPSLPADALDAYSEEE